jgi:ketol-acid reductoisomerase
MSYKYPLFIIGFGSQAQAWASNLKDSKVDFKVALREDSSSAKQVQELKHPIHRLQSEPLSAGPCTILLLTPDHTHLTILQELSSRNFLPKESRIIYAHGVSVLKHKINTAFPEYEHLLLAPKSIANMVRSRFLEKRPIAAVSSTEFAKNPKLAEDYLRNLGKNLGFTKIYSASFKEETLADLLSEQSLLCSLLPYGALHCYNKLREKGVSKEVAYLESWLEVKLIADAMVEMGPESFFKLISPNALLGSDVGQKAIFNEDYQQNLEKLADNIWSGQFIESATDDLVHETREEVLAFWKQQELTKTHNYLGPEVL